MPEVKSRDIAVAVDMYGCPNRCRHCYLGFGGTAQLGEEELRWAAKLFRGYIKKGHTKPFIEKLTITSWFREPDFAKNYRRLYELEAEVSDGKPARFELLSVWRLARDKDYAKWAKEVGPDTCQISFFGLEETNDWFHGRKGAFADNLVATERLLEAGIRPRWQLFLTSKIIPEIGELLKLIEQLKLRERVESLGGDFVAFLHTPSPDGEARRIEYLRPTIEEAQSIPRELIDASKKHFKKERLWRTEGELISRILAKDEKFPYAYQYPEVLWFLINYNWDVFSNVGTLEPWWRLGNLRKDTMHAIFDNFEKNRVLGLETVHSVPAKKLAKHFGKPNSSLIYDSKSDLERLFVAKYCEDTYRDKEYGPP
ncbi:MAG: hypothetical protein ACYS8I_04165 [Planctomycetota bacterium]|jgi:MoaA/NifB/PqqE/SkfB family radical SAM enzyme